MHRWLTLRLILVYGAVFILTGSLVAKLSFIQLVYGETLAENGRAQYTADAPKSFARGSIFFEDRTGTRFRAATFKTGFTIAIHPGRVSDAAATFEVLKTHLPDLERRVFLAKAAKSDDPYEEIAERVPAEDAEAIIAADLSGVYAHKDAWRYYPWGERAAHLLGFVGYNGDRLEGRYGIERYYDDALSRGGERPHIDSFAEVFASLSDVLGINREHNPENVVLSIEPNVQRVVETALADTLSEWSAKDGGIIVMRPDTGALAAMAVRPAFDPNTYQTVSDYSVLDNPLVENVFELGSIMKPLTMAMGIDAGVVAPSDTYNDTGRITIDDATISNYDGEARGVITFQEVLNQSLNVGAVHVQQALGNEAFGAYLRALELDAETGIDLPGEIAGQMTVLAHDRDVEYATASFGQGIAPTPIGMTRALATLANDGVLVTPHVGEYVTTVSGEERHVAYAGEKHVFKEETAETVTRMLVRTVDEALQGGTVALPHHSIAAKTGTAQIAKPSGGGYYDDRYLHSFFGYFPAFDPEFLVFTYIREPDARYASETLTAPFMRIARFLINYYEIPPDR